jgi:outer membrane protein OmpA-like peptidoglycan-associated protein
MRKFFFAAIFLTSQLISAQDASKKIAEADKWFNIKDYKKALPLYLEALKINPEDIETNYAAGICYFESSDDKTLSLPYLRKASTSSAVPPNVNLYYGRALHLEKLYDEAITAFTKYKAVEKDPVRLEVVNRYIAYSTNAKRYDKATIEVVVQNMGSPINTANTEYGPVISADGEALLYTSLKPVPGKTNIGKPVMEEEVLYAKKDASYGGWATPVNIGIPIPVVGGLKSNVGSVGLSPDGQKLLLYMGTAANTGDIYRSVLQGEKWSPAVKLGPEVNSNMQESSASYSPDEKTVYFASNRPGGLGGMDIYKATKNADGTWGKPVNLGAPINSKYDEDFPFIHPDGKTLYYTSNGLGSMGGQDIFKITSEGGKWSAPVNMGAPINTIYNDGYFVLTADGKFGYFSSDRPGGMGGNDIYFTGIGDEQGVVPLTLMKGRILAGAPPKPIATKIKVINNATKEIIKDVYQPNVKTGNYLVIFPPGQNYDMIVEAEGYKPNLVNIYVPNQNYFYEIYQEIILTPVIKDGKIVGQSIEVKNQFDDIEKNNPNATKNNAEVFSLMNGLLSASDSAALKGLMETAYSEELSVAKATAKTESVKAEYFYADASGKLKPFIVGSDTLYTLQNVNTKEQTRKAIASQKQVLTTQTVLKPNQVYIFYFDTDKTDIKPGASPELTKLYDFLKANTSYGVKIAGYTDSDGSIERNITLSEARARSVSKYLIDKGIPKERMIAMGYGSADPLNNNANEEEKKLNRRVEVTLLELKKAK